MATRFVNLDHDTPLLLPPNLRDWVPADHLVHFILDAVDGLDLRQVRVNTRGTGSEQYPPRMLLALLIDSDATGTFSRRRLEQSTHDSVPVRLLTADTHPDHDTIGTFCRQNQALLHESFVQGSNWPKSSNAFRSAISPSSPTAPKSWPAPASTAPGATPAPAR